MVGPENPTIYVLIPYKSFEAFAGAYARRFADPEYQKNGSAVLDASATDPAIVRMENSLMVAVAGMLLKSSRPTSGRDKRAGFSNCAPMKATVKRRTKKKIEMFNTAEIAIFRRSGLLPVFFGDTLVGQKMPQLTYMLTFDSMESHDKNWRTFAADPEWKTLSTTPGYTDAEIVFKHQQCFSTPDQLLYRSDICWASP